MRQKNGDEYTVTNVTHCVAHKCYGGEEVEEDEMAGHATRMRGTMYIYSISV
jgi:hypothetical protein